MQPTVSVPGIGTGTCVSLHQADVVQVSAPLLFPSSKTSSNCWVSDPNFWIVIASCFCLFVHLFDLDQDPDVKFLY